MFNFKNLIFKKEEETPKIVTPATYKIDLDTILFLIKYGNEINLKISINDIYEDGMILALRRTLELDGILIEMSQWAEWTISISLFNNNESLLVASASVRNEFVHWNNSSNFIGNSSNIAWIEEGNWCKVIHDKLYSLKSEIEQKRKKHEEEMVKAESKKIAIQEEEKAKKRAIFKDLYK